eukprot:TRINITY_DN50806_c0_g1_i1.p1 TRINITY_DN50806_c0_g1~~TRINITY_DN50806_c0_g1_i1.p1  ORF type:complete len:495 (-),score=102.93 TRINITY_DN50806_c0_g1_i1:386-1834(-)
MAAEAAEAAAAPLVPGGPSEPPTTLRFRVGDRVKCICDGHPYLGTVVARHWRRFDWPEGQTAPYQVELDVGILIYVPEDTEEFCTRLEVPWWEPAFNDDIPDRSRFDRPGSYLVVNPTWISDGMERGGKTLADLHPPANVQILEVAVCGDRVRGRVLEPKGWISLRSTDDEKIFAVPSDSAYARCFREQNPEMFAAESSSDASESTCATAPKRPEVHLCIKKLRALYDASSKPDLNQKDDKGRTLLTAALHARRPDAVDVALELGACPNLEDTSTGKSPLHFAVQSCPSAVAPLLRGRADPNLKDKNPIIDTGYKSTAYEDDARHRTPLHYAVELSRSQIVLALLNARANPNLGDAKAVTPLHLAVEDDHDALVDLLIAHGADVNLGNRRIGMDSSPLLQAVYAGNSAMAQKLLRARADLSATGKGGMTALHVAARGRHEDLARLLVAAGCDARREAMGRTAADLAARNGMEDLAAFLRSQG